MHTVTSEQSVPYNLDQISVMSEQLTVGFDQIRKAIEFLAGRQRLTEQAVQAYGIPLTRQGGLTALSAQEITQMAINYGLNVDQNGVATI